MPAGCSKRRSGRCGRRCSLDRKFFSREQGLIWPAVLAYRYKTGLIHDQLLIARLADLGVAIGFTRQQVLAVGFNVRLLTALFDHKFEVGIAGVREGANKRGNSSRLTQSFHFFMFEPIFSPVNASNQPI